MPRQLIYTSAARGLTPGQSGYCTVARSRDLREALIPKLEKLSYYTPESNHNPIICAHRFVEVRGTKFHVLTRVVDAGLDFTKRRSFLAHHLVFDPEELRDAATPAEIFLHWKGWLQNWHGDPQWLEDNRPLPTRARRESTIAKHDLWISGRDADRNDFLLLLVERGANWEIAFTNCFQPGDNPADFDIKAAWPNTPGYGAAQRLGAEFIRLAELPETPKSTAAPVAAETATVTAVKSPVQTASLRRVDFGDDRFWRRSLYSTWRARSGRPRPGSCAGRAKLRNWHARHPPARSADVGYAAKATHSGPGTRNANAGTARERSFH